MLFLTGDTRSKKIIRILKRHGIGRMVIDAKIKPYRHEMWAFDNGAYRDYCNGKQFDENRYLRSVDMVQSIGAPHFTVVPDIVAGSLESLDFSMTWFDKLPREWRKYLAVQDGMLEKHVEPILSRFDGIFLGGTSAFKSTALFWSRLAKKHGKSFHYGRCGTLTKIQHARIVQADSCDSAFPLWMYSRIAELLSYLEDDPPQLEFGFPEFYAQDTKLFL